MRHNPYPILFAAIFALLLPTIVFGQTSALYRDLAVGSVGEDVRLLQQWLNSHGFKIAASGPGSPGAETTYFGQLTKTALARYQVEFGIVPVTGGLDSATRASIAGPSVVSEASNLPNGCLSTSGYSPLTGVRCDGVVVQSTSAANSTSNPIPVVSTTNPSNVLSSPASLNFSGLGLGNLTLPPGLPKEVPRDLSKLAEGFVGYSLPPAPPVDLNMKITSVTPEVVGYGGQLIIVGTGFAAKNKVYLGYGVVEAPSTDEGTKIKVTVKPDFLADSSTPSGAKVKNLPMRVMIVTDKGRSNDVVYYLKP